MAKTAIYICDCMGQISDPIDTASLEALAHELEPQAHVRRVGTLCTTEDLQRLQQELREQGVERLLVAGCSPRTSLKLPEQRLMAVARAGGVDPCLVEVANIREQCAWIHPDDRPGATAKARDILRMAHARLCGAAESAPGGPAAAPRAGAGRRSRWPRRRPSTWPRADVPVTLVEQQAYIGGGRLPAARSCSRPRPGRRSARGPAWARCRPPRRCSTSDIELLTGAECSASTSAEGNFHGHGAAQPALRRRRPLHLLRPVRRRLSGGGAKPLRARARRRRARPSTRRSSARCPTRWSCCRSTAPTAAATASEVCPTEAIDLQARAATTLERAAGAVILATGAELRDAHRSCAPDPDVDHQPRLRAHARRAGRWCGPPTARSPSRWSSCSAPARGPASSKTGAGVPYCSKTCCAVTAKQVERLAMNTR